jgi:tRNA 2-thiocytidine biosynthesis protein TtcA
MRIKIEPKILHYTGKAIACYNMIQKGDRVVVCLSGGKDSFTLATLLQLLQLRTNNKFTLHVLVIDQGLPGWNRADIVHWLETNNFSFTILTTKIFNIVKIKKLPQTSPCILCSRLRRGHIYSFAKEHNYNKVALGHHRDDLVVSLLMSIFYNGALASMPPKLLTNDEKLIVIRPLVFCQENDILEYARAKKFPLTTADICGAKKNSSRYKMEQLVKNLATINKKIPANILHSLSKICPSQLMDTKMWDFKNLEELLKKSAEK